MSNMKHEKVSDYFYSNCLIEALKAKIKNPSNVVITYVPRSEKGTPHFLWSDGVADFDFGVDERLEWWQTLVFKGCIRKRNLGFNEKYKKLMSERMNCPACGQAALWEKVK